MTDCPRHPQSPAGDALRERLVIQRTEEVRAAEEAVAAARRGCGRDIYAREHDLTKAQQRLRVAKRMIT